jgi:tripartite-type tricarboxylate transporter receptor subunit TctC
MLMNKYVFKNRLGGHRLRTPDRPRAFRSALIVAIAAGTTAASGALAQPAVEQFYKGKTIDLIIGYPPGGSNNVFARFVAAHMGKYIPGNPNIITRNMPGGGSLLAANYVYSIAPKDGTVLAIASPTIPLDAKLGNKNVKFDPDKFNWIGRTGTAANVLFVWHTTPFKSWRDALTQEITLSATGAGSTVSVYPTVLNNVMKTRFRLIMGYKGSGEAMLAMERGETAGHNTAWEALKTQHPAWLTDNKIRILVQFALQRQPEMPNVPTAIEIAQTDEQRAILRAVLNATEIGKPFFTTPGVPAERVQALRRAFDKMVKDPAFKAEFDRANVELNPKTGEELQKLVEELVAMPPALLEKVKANYGG